MKQSVCYSIRCGSSLAANTIRFEV